MTQHEERVGLNTAQPFFFAWMGKELVHIRLDSEKDTMLPKKRRRSIRQSLRAMLFLLLGVLFLFSVCTIVRYMIDSGQDKKSFRDLATTVTWIQQAEALNGLFGLIANVPDTQQIATDTVYTEYVSLYEENNDFVGWLHIDNTNIDYPVMCTPEDPEYYLHRAFDRSDSQGGTPFISKDSTIDSDFYIIYGHNMKNDTMFGTLDYYTKKSFWEANPRFSFTTVTEQREYEVFAALKTRVLRKNETGYRYYFQVGDLTEDAFDVLIDWFRQNALYDTGIIPTYGEQIVVLSTCSYHEENGRFIIVARRVDHAE